MREARLARAAAPRRRRRSRPSRRCGAARGTAARDQRPLRREQARDRVDARHLERLVGVERRQDARQPAGEHRLAGARRPGEQQVVAAGGRDLERAPRPLLPAHVARGRARPARRVAVRRARYGGGSRSPRRYATASARCRDRHGLDAGERGLGAPTRRRRRGARARPAARPPPRRARRGPGGGGRRARARRSRRGRASASGGSWRDAARIASAIGRSKPEPSLRSVGRREVDGDPAAAATRARRSAMPLRTRSFASWQARSARPTIVNAGHAALRGAPRPRPGADRGRRARG